MLRRMRVRCGTRVEELIAFERRLSWCTDRLVESTEPTWWVLSATIDGQTSEGLAAFAAIASRRSTPLRSVRVKWELVADAGDGSETLARITGTMKRFSFRRVRLTADADDGEFLELLTAQMTDRRFRTRRRAMPGSPVVSVAALAGIPQPIPRPAHRPVVPVAESTAEPAAERAAEAEAEAEAESEAVDLAEL